MEYRESARLHAVQTPIIPTIAAMIREHPGTISLGQGVVYYGPPPNVVTSVENFCRDPAQSRYGAVEGQPLLRELIAKKLRAENGITAAPHSQIIVTAGANMGFLNALFAIADIDDEIILPTPYYFNQEMAARMLGCRPVFMPTLKDYQLDLDALRAGITARTRAIVTISPNNPSGAVYSEESLRAVNQLCAEHGLYHISDEAYENFVYGSAKHFSPGSIDGAPAHTISLFSLSKAYGFASWRIGYMVVPSHLFSAVMKVQDTNLICAPLISQNAAIAALNVGSDYCREKIKAIAEVREHLLRALAALAPQVTVGPAHGALYVLAEIATTLSSLELVERLVAHYRVAAIPGIAFGLQRSCHLRISYGALDQATAEDGIRRLVDGLKMVLTDHPIRNRGCHAQ
jgi:aspartate/methionine/tyrosine aminotransferase